MRFKKTLGIFKIPLIVGLGLVTSAILTYLLRLPVPASLILIVIIFVGSVRLTQETISSIRQGKFAVDYIAFLAILVSLVSGQFFVAGIIVLMWTGGRQLEVYGVSQAQNSLTALSSRVPDTVSLWEDGKLGRLIKISKAQVGDIIAVRRGEVIPLDGELVSQSGLTDESSLTGEPYTIDKIQGDEVRSGTVNIGNTIIIKVWKVEADSTYKKIINMVKRAQKEKSPLIRLADRYSVFFTIVTLLLAVLAYLISHDLTRVLAVLVIATPCPLILATPIALMGGVNVAAKKKIIIKKMSSIEALSRVDSIIFDKTGTITVGRPILKKVSIEDDSYSRKEVLAIAEAIERNSLHPLAKAIVESAKRQGVQTLRATDVVEEVGKGITASVKGKNYILSKTKSYKGMAIQLAQDKKIVAIFEFEDSVKEESKEVINKLKNLGLRLAIFTGDKKEVVEKLAKQMGIVVDIKAECTPEDKKEGIARLKEQGRTTAMIGDGINDAPALAFADVGMVFSNEEQTASTEAADIIFLGGDFAAVINSIFIGRRTIGIAIQSIVFGIGLSILGMLFATFGYILPLHGALLQETIDILVIFNALRAANQ